MVVMSRLIASLGLALLVAACQSSGAVDNPIARRLTWFSYVNGDDLRAACRPGAPDRYRLIYNGVYNEQVRSYDIMVREFASDAGADMVVRVKEPPRLGVLRLGAPFAPWEPTVSRVALDGETFAALVTTLDKGGAFAPAPRGLRLNSGKFYWVVDACRDGVFTFNAFVYPSPRFAAVDPSALLARLAPEAPPFNPPRRVDRAPLPSQCGRPRDASAQCEGLPFIFEVGDNGLLGLASL